MSDMEDRYLTSQKLRPVQAKQIPNNPVNHFDQNSEFQEGFTTMQRKGDATTFTAKALEHYDDELRTVVIPDGFSQLEDGIPLHRWNPSKKYYTPGQYPG